MRVPDLGHGERVIHWNQVMPLIHEINADRRYSVETSNAASLCR